MRTVRLVAAGTVLNNYAHIFDLLIRLRQAVNHPCPPPPPPPHTHTYTETHVPRAAYSNASYRLRAVVNFSDHARNHACN